MRKVRIGIRQLVEFCCRSGDLGYGAGPTASALEGIRTHQKIQRRYARQASAEHSVVFETRIGEVDIELGGRADLLFEQETPPRIEEIKTVYGFAQELPDNFDESSWAQVKCYAACYVWQHQIDEIAVSLNYVNLLNCKENRRCRIFTRAELEGFIQGILDRYLEWHRLVSDARDLTSASARELEFPHRSFRAQQHRFSASVYRAIRQGDRLLIEAPTGSGKTISTLFPSVKAIGEGIAEQIIYLSAKTSGQNEALKAIEQMIDKGLQVSYLVIQAKAKCCPCTEGEAELDAGGKCIRTLGFFDRLSAAREALFRRRKMSIEVIGQVADQHCLCPFELTLQMLPWVDIAICDFNYIFDPLVQLSYFKIDRKRKVLLIDEMHNLVDRARSMYSASINRGQIVQATTAHNSAAVNRAIGSIGNALDKSARQMTEPEEVGSEVPDSLTRAANRFGETLGLELFNDKRISGEALEFARAIFRFQNIGALYGSHHRTIAKKPLVQREVKLLCLNAFEYLRKTYPMFCSVCGFSATLSPANYYLQALGLGERAQSSRLECNFPPAHLQVIIGSYIDTRYRQRDANIEGICATIVRSYRARPGNYLVFFSSYAFMQKVNEHFVEQDTGIETLVQLQSSDDAQRAEYLAQFSAHKKTLGFAIMGGIFAEGIDYAGQSLIGAIIVGVGLPHANTEQQLIESDFSAMQLNAFDYAYRFPGLTRVQQSAGRVIRSEDDRGVVVLLDRRFQQRAYREHFPPHWQASHCKDIDALERSLLQFWERVGRE